jgi:hypothetical protein
MKGRVTAHEAAMKTNENQMARMILEIINQTPHAASLRVT